MLIRHSPGSGIDQGHGLGFCAAGTTNVAQDGCLGERPPRITAPRGAGTRSFALIKAYLCCGSLSYLTPALLMLAQAVPAAIWLSNRAKADRRCRAARRAAQAPIVMSPTTSAALLEQSCARREVDLASVVLGAGILAPEFSARIVNVLVCPVVPIATVHLAKPCRQHRVLPLGSL